MVDLKLKIVPPLPAMHTMEIMEIIALRCIILEDSEFTLLVHDRCKKIVLVSKRLLHFNW